MMLVTVSNPEVLQPLLDRNALGLECLYQINGQRLNSKNFNGVGELVLLTAHLDRACQIYLQAVELFAELNTAYHVLSRVLTDDNPEHFVPVMNELARRLMHVATHHFDLAYCYLSWHAADDYPVMHHLIVALTLSQVGASSQRFSNVELESMVKAALTMNIGMLTLQARLRTQVEPLSREQKEAIRRHPERGANKLKLLGVEDTLWLETVELHHELPDGSGYPQQLANTHEGSVLLGICDSFNARMAMREYRANFTAEQAVQELFAQGHPLVSDFAAVLLECLGIYPPGSLVQLQGNEIACSLLRGQSAISPVVLAFRNLKQSSKQALMIHTDQEGFHVKASLPRRDQGALPGLLELLARLG